MSGFHIFLSISIDRARAFCPIISNVLSANIDWETVERFLNKKRKIFLPGNPWRKVFDPPSSVWSSSPWSSSEQKGLHLYISFYLFILPCPFLKQLSQVYRHSSRVYLIWDPYSSLVCWPLSKLLDLGLSLSVDHIDKLYVKNILDNR